MDGLVLYLSVQFLNSNKTYWYISDDLSVQVGDFVCVQIDEEIKVCSVASKCMYTKDNTPYPYQQTKHIISKIDPSSVLQFIVCPNIKMCDEYNDCGHYDSSSFSAKDLPIKIYDECFTIDGNKIVETKNPNKEDIILLPDGCSEANLYVVEEVSYPDYEGEGYDIVKQKFGINTNTIIIPKDYRCVDVSEVTTDNLFLSSTVQEITISSSFDSYCKTLYIPRDLKKIKLPYQTYGLNGFDKIIVDSKNEFFKLENGVLYFLENGKKFVYWVSRYVQKLSVGNDIDGVGFFSQKLDLEVLDNSFFEKENHYLRLDSCSSVYKLPGYLNKFRSLIVGGICQRYDVDKEHIKNIVIGNLPTTINNLKCTQSFIKENDWIINGCKTLDDLNRFLEFDPKNTEGFVGFIPRDTYESRNMTCLGGLLQPIFSEPNPESPFDNQYVYVKIAELNWRTIFLEDFKNETKEVIVDVLNRIRQKIVDLFAYKTTYFHMQYVSDDFFDFLQHKHVINENGEIKQIKDVAYYINNGSGDFILFNNLEQKKELGKVYDCIYVCHKPRNYTRKPNMYGYNYVYELSYKKVVFETYLSKETFHFVD